MQTTDNRARLQLAHRTRANRILVSSYRRQLGDVNMLRHAARYRHTRFRVFLKKSLQPLFEQHWRHARPTQITQSHIHFFLVWRVRFRAFRRVRIVLQHVTRHRLAQQVRIDRNIAGAVLEIIAHVDHVDGHVCELTTARAIHRQAIFVMMTTRNNT